MSQSRWLAWAASIAALASITPLMSMRKRRRHVAAQRVLALDRIAVVQMRNVRQQLAERRSRRKFGIGARERGAARQRARHLVIEHVIRRAVREDDARPHQRSSRVTFSSGRSS